MSTKDRDTTQKPSNKLFEIILDDLDFTFPPPLIMKAMNMWKKGATSKEIADVIRPKGNRQKALDETNLLLMHLRRKKRIMMES